MPAPTFVAAYNVNYANNVTPKTLTITTQPGDLVVVYAGSENGTTILNTPSGNGITFTQHQSIHINNTWADAAIWSGVDTTGGTNWTLTMSQSGASIWWGFSCLVFRNATGVGASAKINTTSSGNASLSLTTNQTSSAIVVFSADWEVGSGAVRTWKTVNGITPTSGNGLETTFVASAQYLVYGAYYSDAGAAGAKTIGYDTNASQKYSMVAIEVLGTVPSPLAAYSFNATGSAGSTLTAGTSITDDSGNSNTLVTQNGASTMSVVAGSNGVAVESNGMTYAEVQNTSAIKPTTAVTWMCWIRMTGNTWDWGQIFGRNNDDTGWGDAFSFYLDNNNRAALRFLTVIHTDDASGHSDHSAASTALTLNTWTHIAATWSAVDGTVRVFINGSEVSQFVKSASTIYYGSGGNTTRYFSIFRNTQYNEVADQIQIDDVRVFDTQLTASEITTLMNTPVASLGGSTTIPLNWVMGVNT